MTKFRPAGAPASALRWAAGAALLTAALIPSLAQACACGCNIFDVGSDPMVAPSGHGVAYVEYDSMDQSHNWSGTSGSASVNNPDKQIKTDFITFGGQYTINPDWSVSLQVPLWNREFRTENDDGTGVGDFKHAALGDIRIMAQYSGFSADRSTGVTFGVKTASGDYHYANFDRDTEIGSGSTDLLLGAYHAGALNADTSLTYFARVLWDAPLAWRGGYRPGQEVAAAVGGRYLAASYGKIKIATVLQVLASARARDSGVAADPVGSGYERALLSPGVEVDNGNWKLYGDVEFPVYQRINGDQLTAPSMFKVVVSRGF